jgi:hypothetical protein
MNGYPLTRHHLWMLQAIHLARFKGDAAGLESLIGTADWLDHSLPTFAEFNDAIYHLKQARLLTQKDQTLRLSRTAQLLFQEFGKFHPAKQRDALRSRLTVVELPPGSYDPNPVTAPEIFLPEEVYAQAIRAYQS